MDQLKIEHTLMNFSAVLLLDLFDPLRLLPFSAGADFLREYMLDPEALFFR